MYGTPCSIHFDTCYPGKLAPGARLGQSSTEHPIPAALHRSINSNRLATHLACHRGMPMLQIAARDKPNTQPACSDVELPARRLRGRTECGDLTVQYGRIRFGGKSQRAIPAAEPSPAKQPNSNFPFCASTCSRLERLATSATVAPDLPVTRPRIKRSRNCSVTRPIEARGNMPVFQVKTKEE